MKMMMMRACSRLALWLLVIGISSSAAHAGLLISADFGRNGSSNDFSGSEAVAATSDSIFAAANNWNSLKFVGNAGPSDINPSFSGLVDSAGNATSVGLAFTGPVRSFESASADKLRGDYIFINSGYNPSNSLAWTINGLKPGATYKFFAYGSDRNLANWNLSLDTTGAGGLVTQVVNGNSGTAFFSSIVASGLGTISGTMQVTPGTEGNWSGFQLAEVAAVPEPGSLALAGLGALGAAAGAWRRRRQAAR